MTDLPYTLTTGVTATNDGLVIDDPVALSVMDSMLPGLIPWPTVAERLRYRERQPWCVLTMSGGLAALMPADRPAKRQESALHRLAAMLVEDAYSFRVLHRLIKEHL